MKLTDEQIKIINKLDNKTKLKVMKLYYKMLFLILYGEIKCR